MSEVGLLMMPRMYTEEETQKLIKGALTIGLLLGQGIGEERILKLWESSKQ